MAGTSHEEGGEGAEDMVRQGGPTGRKSGAAASQPRTWREASSMSRREASRQAFLEFWIWGPPRPRPVSS